MKPLPWTAYLGIFSLPERRRFATARPRWLLAGHCTIRPRIV